MITADTLRSCITISVEILVMWFVIYWFLRLLKGTLVPMLVYTGTIILGSSYVLASCFNLMALKWIIQQFCQLLPLIVVILLKDELRHIIGMMKNHFNTLFVPPRASSTYDETTIAALSAEITRLSLSYTGALIAIEQNMNLERYYQENGKIINAELIPGNRLLETIFYKGSPLHDGGVIIRKGRVVATSCPFPLTENTTLQRTNGMRHQAAFGMSERTDAIILVVSEETGNMHFIKNSVVIHIESQEQLLTILKKHLLSGERKKPFWMEWFKRLLTRAKALRRLVQLRKQEKEHTK